MVNPLGNYPIRRPQQWGNILNYHELSQYLLTGAKRREFSGMIHFITSNHPSNPQQPIHSLRLAPVSNIWIVIIHSCSKPPTSHGSISWIISIYWDLFNNSPWKIHPFLSSVNHLFLWAIYPMAMLVITRWYFTDLEKLRPGTPAMIKFPRRSSWKAILEGLGNERNWEHIRW